MKSLTRLLSCEEKETSAVRAQAAIAHLAKNFSQELPTEMMMNKQSTEVHREPMADEHPSDQQQHNCCPQPPWHRGRCVYPAENQDRQQCHQPRNAHALSALSLMFPLLFHFPFLSNTLSSLYLCGEEAISVGKRPFWSPAKPPFQAQAELSTFSGRAVHT